MPPIVVRPSWPHFFDDSGIVRAGYIPPSVDHSFVGGSLLTPFGRRDSPSPASGQWQAIADLVHKSLLPAGSRARQRIVELPRGRR